jgi:hypothetical protein
LPPAGWYPDAHGQNRYWDGQQWTEHLAPPAPIARPTLLTRDRSPAFWWALVAALVMVIGGFGPWATAFNVIDVSGTRGDGWIVIGAAAIAAGLLWVSPRGAGPILAVLAGVGGLIVGVIDFNDIASRSALVHPAWGIYAVIAGSGALGIASVAMLVSQGPMGSGGR